VTKRPIIAYKIKTKKWFRYESLTDASILLKIDDVSSIFKVLKGTYKQVKGISFAYEDTDYVNDIMQKLSKPIAKRGLEKKLLVTDTYGNTETYDSLREASSYLQISRSHICQCARGNRQHKDFTFQYLN
jgi:hypothetical protein